MVGKIQRGRPSDLKKRKTETVSTPLVAKREETDPQLLRTGKKKSNAMTKENDPQSALY